MSGPTDPELLDRLIALLVDAGLPPEDSDSGILAYRFEDSLLLVTAFTSGGRAYVRLTAPVLEDFRPNLALLTRILRLNTEVLFGAFLLFEDDSLAFATTLELDGLEAERLRHALEYVVQVAEDYAEELRALAGGRRPAALLDALD